MRSVTLPKNQYEVLKQKASLYEEIFRFLPQRIFGIESYSKERMREFSQEDKLDRATRVRLEKLLKSL